MRNVTRITNDLFSMNPSTCSKLQVILSAQCPGTISMGIISYSTKWWASLHAQSRNLDLWPRWSLGFASSAANSPKSWKPGASASHVRCKQALLGDMIPIDQQKYENLSMCSTSHQWMMDPQHSQVRGSWTGNTLQAALGPWGFGLCDLRPQR